MSQVFGPLLELVPSGPGIARVARCSGESTSTLRLKLQRMKHVNTMHVNTVPGPLKAWAPHDSARSGLVATALSMVVPRKQMG